MKIRQETPEDYSEIYTLIREAFSQAEYADGTEQDLVVNLRREDAFIPELALVAEEGKELVGYILFTRAKVGGDDVLALAPLAVKPAYQRQGIGTALIREGHRIARELGFGYSLVLGSERYYPREGYRPAKDFGIEVPEGFPPENFMAIRLFDDAAPISGNVVYPKAFG